MQVQYSAFSYASRSYQPFSLVSRGTVVTRQEKRVGEGKQRKKIDKGMKKEQNKESMQILHH